MLSKSSKYAVKAVVYIVANSSEEKKLLVKEIAEKTNIPRPFLSKILQHLSSRNLLSSTKGPKGGFFINKQQAENSILDIIIETEGVDKLQHCVLNFENCDSQHPCPIHNYIAPAKEALRLSLKDIQLNQLNENGESAFFT